MQQAKTVVILLLGLWLMVNLYYYNNSRPYSVNMFRNRRKYNEFQLLQYYNGTDDYLLNTPGCYIPNYIKKLNFLEAKNHKISCGHRSVFIDKDGYNIKFRIDHNILRTLSQGRNGYTCCYRFVSRSKKPGKEDSQITYSQCQMFENGTTARLQDEVVVVSCTLRPKGKPFYEDAYMFVKKIKMPWVKRERQHWNVLVLGLDTMSRGRFLSTMPKTVRHLSQHGWLDYKGYQKVGSNTFPNLMSFLTGLKMSTVYKKCARMSNCNNALIWSKFKKQGYVTAYGEEDLNLPDTFAHYGFVAPPTDHYMRPLFLTGETLRGNLVCTKQVPSAINVLDYALDFANTYKDNKLFGMFWINSCSHNLDNLPKLFDSDIPKFLDKLNDTGVMSNTFVFFLSDHGRRFGPMRLPVESYYEERLPMFFVKVPRRFEALHEEAYFNLKLNENRLTTPYDLYGTFVRILELSSGVSSYEKSEACPQCTSLFVEQNENRSCTDASVDEKWCSCHNLTSVSQKTPGATTSIKLAVDHIQNIAKSIKTKHCTRCYVLKLKKVLRTHVDVDNVHNKTKYVIALQMSPENLAYEVSILEDERGIRILTPTSTISQYNDKGSCVIRSYDREYCVCEKIKKCH